MDPQARDRKMADGGFRPAYNGQVATVAQGQIVVDITELACGSDRGLMRPMLERLEQRHGCRPRRHLFDGGFHKNDDTEWAAERGIRVYGPPPRSKHKTDPYAPRPKDGPRSEEHTSELQSLMRISYAVFCLKKKNQPNHIIYASHHITHHIKDYYKLCLLNTSTHTHKIS